MKTENTEQIRAEVFLKQIHDNVSILQSKSKATHVFQLFGLNSEFELKNVIELYKRTFPRFNNYDYNYFLGNGGFVLQIKTADCITHSSSNMHPTDAFQMYKTNIIDPKYIPYAYCTLEQAEDAAREYISKGYVDQNGTEIKGFTRGYLQDANFPRGTLDPDEDFDKKDAIGQYIGVLKDSDFYYVVGLTSESDEDIPKLYPIQLKARSEEDQRCMGFCDPSIYICEWMEKPKNLKHMLKEHPSADYHWVYDEHFEQLKYLIKRFNINCSYRQIILSSITEIGE